MPRYHTVNGEDVPFTLEEETSRDIEDAKAVVRKDARAATQYQRDRKVAYPPVGDQLDAILKQMNQDRLGGKALVQGVDDILAAWLGVKSSHPKPE